MIACAPKAEPIDYGKEECAFCKMTIVSPQFASEVVTQKSKAFKYDAIECMLQAPQEDKIALYLVCDYLHENTLIDATKATYLVSKEIQSPMGAHLAAFASREEAQKIQAEKEATSTIGKEFKLSSKDTNTLHMRNKVTCTTINPYSSLC